MPEITAYSVRDIGDIRNPKNQRLEDFAAHELIETAGGLTLQIALVCDGAGGGQYGERASTLAAETILRELRRSRGTDIPGMLVDAIEKANTAVYDELEGYGFTTAAVIAVNVKSQPNGQLYIASVGDSPIFILRTDKPEKKGDSPNTRLVRLNTDHTIVTEHIMQGGHPRDLDVPNPNALTRALGRDRDETGVDIGIYAEKGKDFVSPSRALLIGKKGLGLREGDTIFAVSDGVTDVNPDDGLPFIHEDEFVKHALDSNVERATKLLITYAMARGPNDNVSIAMIFIPSEMRKEVRVGGLSQRAKIALGVAAAVLTLIILALVTILSGTNQKFSDANLTATAVAMGITEQFNYDSTVYAKETEDTAHIIATETAIVLSATPLPTATPTATFTPLPTTTPLPTLGEPGQFGLQKFSPQENLRPLTGDTVSSPGAASYVQLTGDDVEQIVGEPASMLMLPDSKAEVRDVDNRPTRLRVEMLLMPNSSVFIVPQRYVGGVDISLANSDLTLNATGACFSINYSAANEIEYSCYAGENSCGYKSPYFSGSLSGGQQVKFTINNKVSVVGFTEAVSETDAEAYFTSITSVVGQTDISNCLKPYVDDDSDGVLNSVDVCPAEAGPVSWPNYPNYPGCPDGDGDGVPDPADQCPARGNLGWGLTANGCPRTPTPEPDSDHDGVPDWRDACPVQPGAINNRGCPLIPPTRGSQT